MLAETEVCFSLDSSIWRKCISVIRLGTLMVNCTHGLPLHPATVWAGFGQLWELPNSSCRGNPWSPMCSLKPSRRGRPCLSRACNEINAWCWEQLQRRGNRWGRTLQQWEFSAFWGGGVLSFCQDEKEEADLWLAVERHKAALVERSRTGKVPPQQWITACRAKEMANIWVKQLKVKNKCNLSHASAISFAADHVAVTTMCLHVCMHKGGAEGFVKF